MRHFSTAQTAARPRTTNPFCEKERRKHRPLVDSQPSFLVCLSFLSHIFFIFIRNHLYAGIAASDAARPITPVPSTRASHLRLLPRTRGACTAFSRVFVAFLPGRWLTGGSASRRFLFAVQQPVALSVSSVVATGRSPRVSAAAGKQRAAPSSISISAASLRPPPRP